jgi:FkbM family methyltransferase
MKTEVVEFNYREKDFKLLLLEEDYMTLQIKKSGSFYEKIFLDCLVKNTVVNTDMTVVDVGAFSGNHTVFFATFCNNVIAFEPCKNSYARLVKTIAMNRLNNVVVYNKAVGNVDWEVESIFTTVRPNAGAKFWWYTGHYQKSEWYDALTEDLDKEICEVVVMDSFLKDIKIDFLKIDVEGMELEVLKGAKNIIDEQSPLIMIEVLEGRTDKLVREWMIRSEYEKIIIDGWGKNPLTVPTWLIGKK